MDKLNDIFVYLKKSFKNFLTIELKRRFCIILRESYFVEKKKKNERLKFEIEILSRIFGSKKKKKLSFCCEMYRCFDFLFCIKTSLIRIYRYIRFDTTCYASRVACIRIIYLFRFDDRLMISLK